MDKNLRLKDLGERSIVNDLIVERFESVKNNFDDAAVIPSELIEGDIVVTTDPCPKLLHVFYMVKICAVWNDDGFD